MTDPPATTLVNGPAHASVHDVEDLRERFQDVLDAAPDAIVIVDTTGRILLVNVQAEHMFGYTRAELLNATVETLIPERFRATHSAQRADYFAQPRTRPMGSGMQLFARKRDGSQIPVDISLSPLLVAGKNVGMASIRDVTTRVLTENALKAANIELEQRRQVQVAAADERTRAAEATTRERDERFALIADNIPDVLFLMDADLSSMQFINKAYEEVWGRTRESLYADPNSFMEGVVEADRSKVIENIDQVRAGKQAGPIDFRVVRPDGTERWVTSRAMPVRDHEGSVRFISGVTMDTTEHRLLQEQFRQAQKMEAIGRLAGGVAHDFNNLLTVIGSYSEFIVDGLSPNDPRHGDMQEIIKAAQAAASLTRQLLAFSRQEVVRPRVLVVQDIVKSNAKMLTRVIGEDIELAMSLSEAELHVNVDPGQLEQVLMNLVVNARDAMPSGGTLTIEAHRADLDDGYAREHWPLTPGAFALIAVSDTGIGMDAPTRARIFEPFFTTKDAGKGTGLGLATVYGIVKASQGFIWVYSEPGRGSTFKIYLPLVGKSADASQKASAVSHAVGTETILLVEDAPNVRSAVRRMAESLGYHVLEAPSPQLALEIAAASPRIDLLLTDVVMPGMSGRELAERFQSTSPTTKIVYMSGYTDDAVLRHGLMSSQVAFLQKPFSLTAFATTVRAALDDLAHES